MKAIEGIFTPDSWLSPDRPCSTSPVFGAAKEIQIKCGVPGALSELYVQGMLAISDAVKAEGAKQATTSKCKCFRTLPRGWVATGRARIAAGWRHPDGELQQRELRAFEPKISIISMPFLFADFDDAYKFYSSPFVEEITAGLDKKGMKVLGMFTRGFAS